jgi:hypothetical protein
MAPGASSYTGISAATSSSYNFLTSGATATGSWSFVLQVTDATGAAVNSTVSVMLNPSLLAPIVTPGNTQITQGQVSVLSSTAVSTGTGPYSYQWFEKLSPGAYVTTGTNSAAFDFETSVATATGSWSFVLQVTDATGAAVNSTDILVSVVSGPSTPTPTPYQTNTPTNSPSPSPHATASPTPKPTSSSQTPSPSPKTQANSNISLYIYGLVIAIIVVAGIVAAIIVIRMKNKSKAQQNP